MHEESSDAARAAQAPTPLGQDQSDGRDSPRRMVELPVGHKAVQVAVAADGALELWLDGCLRKRRAPSERAPLYVWTNVELHWEEHRFVEARYWPRCGELQVMVNRETAYAEQVG